MFPLMCGKDIRTQNEKLFRIVTTRIVGRKWMVVFECCCRHSSQGSVVNEKVKSCKESVNMSL